MQDTILKTTQDIATLLDGAMTARTDLLNDSKNIVRAVTITIKPSQAQQPPKVVRKQLIDLVKQFTCNTRSKIYVQLHAEYTQALTIHFHGIIISKTTVAASLMCKIRKDFGFCCVKTPDNLQGWITYCNKSNDHKPSYFYA